EIHGYIGGGPKEFPERFKAQDNASLAHQLEGKLLFIHGGLDDDVPVLTTFHVINSLIEHNKDFDLVIIPNYRHNLWDSEYHAKVMWSYFTKHLLNKDLDAFDN
ncbi:MAG: prolyl oligopeptidase family serine peptidase, partial [Pseudomonadota bacterium]